LLEGLIFGHVHQLFDPERPRGARRGYEVTRILADEHHLAVAARGADLPEVIHRILPAWAPGASIVEHGVPGLRVTSSEQGDGISLYLAGQTGRVTLMGISLSEFENYRELQD
jgi:hypothetical protein